jgi:transposase
MAEHVRTVKTSSGATAVQIVRYEKRKRIVVSHIGSARTTEDLSTLKREALEKIEATALQKRLFPEEEVAQSSPILVRNKIVYLGARHTFIYEAIMEIFGVFNFPKAHNQLLLDLILMRIIHPVSKLESLTYLSEMFGIHYKAGSLYQALRLFPKLKTPIEEKIVALAKKQYSFDFSMVFYDVTTLYYESFTEDEDTFDEEGNMIKKGLRKGGLGKEIKIGQPIIVIGLMVTKEGFPVSYEVYEGNTFEGDTFIPSILSFKKKHTIQTLTIVADAAMISFDNVEKLKEHELSYIVGGRMASLKNKEMKQINEELIGQNQTGEELQEIDSKSMRIQTERGLLICDFSFKRYLKDKREMEKQISRAENLVAKNTDGKRTKFLMLKQSEEKTDKKRKKKGEGKDKAYELNTELIEKTKLLLGIKGYYTNLFKKDGALTDQDIINHYHNLWHVEKAFRIAKSDLQARPIFHRKREAVEAHILICFMALAVCKYMELKSGKSTKKIVRLLMSITDARIRNKLTGEIIVMRQEFSEEVEQLWKTLIKPTL